MKIIENIWFGWLWKGKDLITRTKINSAFGEESGYDNTFSNLIWGRDSTGISKSILLQVKNLSMIIFVKIWRNNWGKDYLWFAFFLWELASFLLISAFWSSGITFRFKALDKVFFSFSSWDFSGDNSALNRALAAVAAALLTLLVEGLWFLVELA